MKSSEDRRAPDASGRFGALWVQAISALVAVVVGIVTVQSAGLSPVWRTVLLLLGVLLILGLPLPAVLRMIRPRWAAWVRSRRLRGIWKSFRREVEERRWLYTHMHGHSLGSLLAALRTTQSDAETNLRLRVLQAAVAQCASLDGIRQALDRLLECPWRGAASAHAEIVLFETLIAFPDSVGWLRELVALSSSDGDGAAITEWVARYRNSLEAYSRWARDRNRELGEKVFREHLL